VGGADGSAGATVVFYDGVCGLCNRLTQFLLSRDRLAHLRFAALQSPLAEQRLRRYGRDAADLDTVYVIANWNTPDERLLERSQAVLYALSQVEGGKTLARVGAIFPVPLADWVYGIVARIRYRMFGKFDRCRLPPPDWRNRFLDP
jgi:predicted DCC family thiol-disulfide oxidoreductase YuxK